MNRIEQQMAWADSQKDSASPIGKAPSLLEYIPYENGELPRVADKALAAVIRAIVRDEMFNPPQD